MGQKIALGMVLLGIAALGLLFSGCVNPVNPVNPPPNPSPGAQSAVVQANNQFALELYSKYSANEGNVFFSPFSMSAALAMAYEGAKGQTATEMQNVLHFPQGNGTRDGYANLIYEINKPGQKYELRTANALWAQKDYAFLPEYFTAVGTYYGGKATNMDFRNDAEGSRNTINNWVAQQTNGKIQNLIPQGVINGMTRLVLTNAVYFKGQWVQQFNKDDTRDWSFRVGEGRETTVQMMKKTDEKAIFNYTENDKMQMIELPYSGDGLSMLVLLPKNDDLKGMEQELSVQKLEEWKKGLSEQRVKLYLPKFKFEQEYAMSGDLESMGMPTAFSDSADFSGMTGKKDLKISEVIHKAFVEVNEEGTEAAAATAVVVGTTAIGPGNGPAIPVFMADHPFVFIIQQKGTGAILFIGRVSEPT